VYAPVEGVFGGKAAFRGKYTLFFEDWSSIFIKKESNYELTSVYYIIKRKLVGGFICG